MVAILNQAAKEFIEGLFVDSAEQAAKKGAKEVSAELVEQVAERAMREAAEKGLQGLTKEAVTEFLEQGLSSGAREAIERAGLVMAKADVSAVTAGVSHGGPAKSLSVGTTRRGEIIGGASDTAPKQPAIILDEVDPELAKAVEARRAAEAPTASAADGATPDAGGARKAGDAPESPNAKAQDAPEVPTSETQSGGRGGDGESPAGGDDASKAKGDGDAPEPEDPLRAAQIRKANAEAELAESRVERMKSGKASASHSEGASTSVSSTDSHVKVGVGEFEFLDGVKIGKKFEEDLAKKELGIIVKFYNPKKAGAVGVVNDSYLIFDESVKPTTLVTRFLDSAREVHGKTRFADLGGGEINKGYVKGAADDMQRTVDMFIKQFCERQADKARIAGNEEAQKLAEGVIERYNAASGETRWKSLGFKEAVNESVVNNIQPSLKAKAASEAANSSLGSANPRVMVMKIAGNVDSFFHRAVESISTGSFSMPTLSRESAVKTGVVTLKVAGAAVVPTPIYGAILGGMAGASEKKGAMSIIKGSALGSAILTALGLSVGGIVDEKRETRENNSDGLPPTAQDVFSWPEAVDRMVPETGEYKSWKNVLPLQLIPKTTEELGRFVVHAYKQEDVDKKQHPTEQIKLDGSVNSFDDLTKPTPEVKKEKFTDLVEPREGVKPSSSAFDALTRPNSEQDKGDSGRSR